MYNFLSFNIYRCIISWLDSIVRIFICVKKIQILVLTLSSIQSSFNTNIFYNACSESNIINGDTLKPSNDDVLKDISEDHSKDGTLETATIDNPYEVTEQELDHLILSSIEHQIDLQR